MTDIKAQLNKFNTAAFNLLGVAGLTALNIVLLAMESDVFFLFSAWIPFRPVFNAAVAGEPMTTAVVVGLAITAGIAAAGLASFKWRVLMPLALVFFAIDTAIYGLFILDLIDLGFVEIDVSLMIEVVVRIVVLYCIAVGTMAWLKLKDIPENEITAARDKTPSDTP